MISEQNDILVFPKVNISILDTQIIHLNAFKLQQVLTSIHQLIDRNYHITLKITSKFLTNQSSTFLRKLLLELKNNLNHITLQLDLTFNEAKSMTESINNIKQSYPQIKIGVIIDKIIENSANILQIRRFMSLLETDLYFINLDLISLAELITQKISPIQQDLDLKARIVLFIHSLGSKHAKKLIFNHLTHSAI